MRTRPITGPVAGEKTRPARQPGMRHALGALLILAMLGAGLAGAGPYVQAGTIENLTDEINRALAEAREEHGSAPDAGKVQIFKDYTYGMSRQEVRQKSGAWPCDDPDLKDALCAKKPVSFAGATWEQVFTFDASGLDQVILAKEEIEPEEVFSVFQVLSAENSIVYMNNGLMPFDLLADARVLGFQEAQNMAHQYLVDTMQTGGTLEACLFPDTYIQRLIREKSPSAFASLRNAPANLRVIQLVLSEDEEMVALIFSTPVQFIRKLEKKNLKERF